MKIQLYPLGRLVAQSNDFGEADRVETGTSHERSIDLGLRSARMNELTMGCHSDSGFAHAPRALYSQMIMGESFEAKVIDGDPPADPETPGGSVGGTWPNFAPAPVCSVEYVVGVLRHS